jgi:hypothetical protein
MPEEIIEEWRRNKDNYIRPPLPRDFNTRGFSARQRHIAYRNQPVEAHAEMAGAAFRRETRRFIMRVPDDAEFITVFIFAMLVLSAVLYKSGGVPELSFEECVLAVYDEKIMREKPLKALRNLHRALSAELGMNPLDVYISRDKATSYERVVFKFHENCGPEYIIAEVAGETWKACNFEFGGDNTAEAADYIGGILLRAEAAILKINQSINP